LLLYADGHDDSSGYDARVSALKQRGMLAGSFNEPADQAITRGTLAVAIVRLLEIRGGWALTLLGNTPALCHAGTRLPRHFTPLSSPRQTLTGNEVGGDHG